MAYFNKQIKVPGWLLFIFLCSLMFCLWLGTLEVAVNAQSPVTNQLVQQGLQLYQAGEVKAAITSWEKALNIYQQSQNAAASVIVRENLARVYPEVGKGTQAIEQWQQVITYYRQEGNLPQVGRSLTELAQVYSSLGQPLKAIALLCNPDKNNHCTSDSALQIAQTHKDDIGAAAAWGSLGDANRLTGNYKLAITNLEKGLAVANKLNIPGLRVAVFYSLGNAHISQALFKYRQADSARQRGDDTQKLLAEAKQADNKAGEYLQESLSLAKSEKDVGAEVRSRLRIISLYYRNHANTEAANNLQQTINLLERLPENRRRVYAAISLVRLLQPVTSEATSRVNCIPPDVSAKAIVLLNPAVTIAKKISDFRAESFALGELGHIYECRREYAKALAITYQARLAAEQGFKAKDSLYLWEWQIGRIFQAQGTTNAAISAYERAINIIGNIRSDILTANRDIQFDFRDTIEPIYRELVALRLSLAEPKRTANKSIIPQDIQGNYASILRTMDSLKLAELQNYFGDDCIINPLAQATIEQIGDPKTAFLNSIILEGQIAVILTLPNGQNKQNSISIKRPDFIKKVNNFRRNLETRRNDIVEYDTTLAKQMYDWLIQPFATELQQANIKTLVFIHDGILRSIPMAALYDGEKFLIQKYAIATIPSLSLTDSNPLNRRNLRILALGLSVEAGIDGKRLTQLADVPTEIDGVLEKIPGKKLLNHDFTRDRLNQELNKQAYPIIHIATHGEFGAEPEDTFIVTGKQDPSTANNETISFYELEKQISQITRSNQPLELLTLTACKTAVGDERSALGLAGVAVQAGAKSVIASLWTIQDESTAEIIINFYNKLLNNPSMSKAEALQSAQVEMIEGKTVTQGQLAHPAYWSPLILIGNWL